MYTLDRRSRETHPAKATPLPVPEPRQGKGLWRPEQLTSAVSRWVSETLAASSSPGDEISWVDIIRDGRKRLAIVSFAGGQQLALKQYSDDRGRTTNRWLQALVAAGLTTPSQFRVTPARGWSQRHRTQIADVAPGPSWSQWLRGSVPERRRSARAAAEWVLTLQQLPVALADRTGYRSLAGMRTEVERCLAELPDAGPELPWILEEASRRFKVTDETACRVPSHGDFHPNNLHLLPGSKLIATALDLDTAGLRRPSYDVGYAIAMLLVSSWMHTGSFAAGADAAGVFWRRWVLGGADLEAVPAEIARGLIQSLHFELVTYRTGNLQILPLWTALAREALQVGVEGMLALAEGIQS